LERPSDRLAVGDIARWRFEHDRAPLPRIQQGVLHTHACDDLAAAAAAISAFDAIRKLKGCEHVGLLFTRAEEVGFLGAIAACQHRSVPKTARLICLENSRSFPHDSPIGAGPIVRVGDKMSVFEPTLTNHISMLMMEHQKRRPPFKYQRKLMPGGTCEATTFSTYGYRSTCLCLPLGNYHNMTQIDEVASGKRPARVGPEFISVEDYHGLIEMLLVCATGLDAADAPTLRGRMESLMTEYGFVLEDR
jgi:endoglucanase